LDCYKKKVKFEGDEFAIEITDISGKDELKSERDKAVLQADGTY
jgi:hypothetical protein